MGENAANVYFRKVNYYETDGMGITHHSNYVRFMEEARIHFLEQIGCGYDKWDRDGVISPVIGIECEYKRPTTFGDELQIWVETAEYKRVKLSVSDTMVNARIQKLVFEGMSHHCFTNADGRPIALSRPYPEIEKPWTMRTVISLRHWALPHTKMIMKKRQQSMDASADIHGDFCCTRFVSVL